MSDSLFASLHRLLLNALIDLMGAVDAVCDSDAVSDTLEPHARSALELSLQRARAVIEADAASRRLVKGGDTG